MNQMNNNENILDVDKLYSIAKRLKDFKDERVRTSLVIKKNPNSTMRARYADAKSEYLNALLEFDSFVKEYVRINFEDGIQKINEENLKSFIQNKLNEALDEYFK